MTLSANARRPLFVPPGILEVRTGPTTRDEFDRLMADDEMERSGVRPIRLPRERSGLHRVVAKVLQLAPGVGFAPKAAPPSSRR